MNVQKPYLLEEYIMANKKNKTKTTLLGSLFNSKAKIATASIIAAAIILIIVILIIREGSYGKLIIDNNSGIDLEYVKTSFVNEDSLVDSGMQTGKIAAGEKLTSAMEPIDLEGTESNLEVAFKLAGYDEMFTDVGFFNQRFYGNIKISFSKTDDPDIIKIKIKASNGLFQSSSVNCNVEYEIDLEEGIILD